MLYLNFMTRAMNLVIKEDEDLEMWYLDPHWMDTLYRNGLGHLEDIEGSYFTSWTEVEDCFKLEVERLNMEKKAYIIKWLYDIIKGKAEPLEIEAQNELVDVLLETYREHKPPEEEY